MRAGERYKGALKLIGRYLIFFAVVAFPITCTIMLFVQTMARAQDIILDAERIGAAAKLGFLNVVIISVLFTAVDIIRKKLTTDKTTCHIVDAAKRIAEGDFTASVEPLPPFLSDPRFNEIIDCINKLAEELSGVETLRTDFIANVSHEIKTPLAVIRSYATLLEDESLSYEKRLEYAGLIKDSTRRLSDMITNILKLNRLENQQIYPKKDTFDLSEQLCECLLVYENVWERKNIDIDTDIEDGVTVSQDAELLTLVWNNLLSNAFKFTEEGGSVSLSLSATDTQATVVIRDTGHGMSREVGERIFDKFYQGDTSHATEGNGLGLALVRRVIDIVGGEISVESVIGSGTAFTVKIGR